MFSRCLLGAWVALGAIGCASGPRASLAALQYRSVFDLGCPAHALGLHHVDQRTKVVVGCGRRLVYVETCETNGMKRECTWLLDSPSFAQPTWPATQPSPAAPVAAAPVVTSPVVASPAPPPRGVAASTPPAAPEGRPIRTNLDGSDQSVIPAHGDARRPLRTDLFDDDQTSILEHRR